MRAFYDLQSSPPTYDYFSFLICADNFRKERGAESLEIVIVPGPKNGFRDDGLPPFTVEWRRKMLSEVVVKGSRLMPSVTSVICPNSRGEALALRCSDKFPEQYNDGESHYGFNRAVEAMSHPLYEGLKAERLKILPDRTVTITLRESSYWPMRNSQLDEWLKLADWLDGEGWNPLFIRDHESSQRIEFESIENIDVLDRAAVYEAADLNLLISNGPSCIAYHNPRCNYLMCKMESENFGRGFYRWAGLEDQLPNSTRKQKIAWHDDKFELIRDSFIEVMSG